MPWRLAARRTRAGVRLWKASCPPRQGDNVPARFKRGEPISETANVLDAFSEVGRLVVSARRSVAGRVPQSGRADIWRRAKFGEQGLEASPERVRRDVDPEPRLHLPRPFRPGADHGTASAGEGKLVGLAGAHRPKQRH